VWNICDTWRRKIQWEVSEIRHLSNLRGEQLRHLPQCRVLLAIKAGAPVWQVIKTDNLRIIPSVTTCRRRR
jgi:hypothetical protein